MLDGSPFHTWPVGDTFAENLFVVQARHAQIATIEELAVSLERPSRTLYLAWSEFSKDGVSALIPQKRGPPKGAGRDAVRDATIRRLHSGGLSGRAIARQVGTSPLTVTRALERMGLTPNVRRQQTFADVEHAEGSQSSEVPARVSETPEDAGTIAQPAPAPAAPANVLTGRTLDANPLFRSMDRFLASQGALQDAVPLFAAA